MRMRTIASFLLSALMVTMSLSALADEHRSDDRDRHDERDHRDEHNRPKYVHHSEWRKGARMRDEDWRRGELIDYRERNLRAPPRGYEWRQVDGSYVLAAVATGVIASVIIASMERR